MATESRLGSLFVAAADDLASRVRKDNLQVGQLESHNPDLITTINTNDTYIPRSCASMGLVWVTGARPIPGGFLVAG